jgi:hypothetical protein
MLMKIYNCINIIAKGFMKVFTGIIFLAICAAFISYVITSTVNMIRAIIEGIQEARRKSK